jgi:hypothetical protein
LYEPTAKIRAEIAETMPVVRNVWSSRVPSPSGVNVASFSPRNNQLPNRDLTWRGRSAARTSVGLRIGPKWET